jgi:Arc/MetJ family transcription regulator
MATNVLVDDKVIKEALKLGNFKTKQEAMNVALTEFVRRRNRLRILELAGKIEFRPDWDYKKMRGKR